MNTPVLKLLFAAVFAVLSFPEQILGQDTAAKPDFTDLQTHWDRMKNIVPRFYVAGETESPPTIDGRLEEAAWRKSPWSTSFVDIEGIDTLISAYRTRMKIVWDNDYMYIGAELEEPHVWATLSERNTVIYNDDDFEVFIDPNGDNHNYYELEINALSTIWELRLVRPYRDGGPVISGENIDGLLSAVNIMGTLNNPTDSDSGWAVEIAIPWQGFQSFDPSRLPPIEGDVWRMNFSRVDYDMTISTGEYVKKPDLPARNWVWSPQGIVDMHAPERWGFVLFQSATRIDLENWFPKYWTQRECLMEIYHRQRAFRDKAGVYAKHPHSVNSDCFDILNGSLVATDTTFSATIISRDQSDKDVILRIDDAGRLSISERE